MHRIFHRTAKFVLALSFGALLVSALVPAAAAETKSVAPGLTRWICNAFYLPARSIWQRTVAIQFEASDVLSVQIDDVLVYAFNIQGTTVLTAVDGERIQFDPATQSWASDLRGVVTSEGRCERSPA